MIWTRTAPMTHSFFRDYYLFWAKRFGRMTTGHWAFVMHVLLSKGRRRQNFLKSIVSNKFKILGKRMDSTDGTIYFVRRPNVVKTIADQR